MSSQKHLLIGKRTEVNNYIRNTVKTLNTIKKDDINTFTILVDVMEFIEKLPDIVNKQYNAVYIINEILPLVDLPKYDEKKVIHDIDLIISLTKGEVDINKIADVGIMCLPKIKNCLIFLKKNKGK